MASHLPPGGTGKGARKYNTASTKLAPAAPDESSGSTAAGAGKEGVSKRSAPAPGRKYASRACLQCRKKKRRCDGEPCTSCAREGIVCIMDLDTDQRRQINRNDRGSRDRLSGKIIDALRSTSLENAHSLLDAIRSETTPTDLEALVDRLDDAQQDVEDMHMIPDNNPLVAKSDGTTDDQPQPTPTDTEMSFTYDETWTQPSPSQPQSLNFGSAESDIFVSSTHFKSDRLSQAMLSFREAAGSQIAGGIPSTLVLSMSGITVDLLFRDRIASDPHTVSTWGCELAKSYNTLDRALKLALIYFAASFMRWLILPCRGTYTLMSKIMRPIADDSIIHDAAEVEYCRNYALKWITQLIMGGYRHKWSYAFTSCMRESAEGEPRFLSDFFMGYCDDVANWEQTRVSGYPRLP